MTTDTGDIASRLLASAQDIRGVGDFKEWTRGPIRQLLPHGPLACGFGRVHAGGVGLDGVIAVDFPVAHLDSIRNKAGGIDTPIIRRWMATREPQLFESDSPWPDCPPDWLASFNKHRLVNTAAHAQYDTVRCIGTYFSFHRIEGRLGDFHRQALLTIVPVMHEVMYRVITTLDRDNPFLTQLASLTAREKELLEWLRLGKSNGEIALIVKLSETTVKHHLTRIFGKLDVDNRVQLIRRLSEESGRNAIGNGTKVF